MISDIKDIKCVEWEQEVGKQTKPKAREGSKQRSDRDDLGGLGMQSSDRVLTKNGLEPS